MVKTVWSLVAGAVATLCASGAAQGVLMEYRFEWTTQGRLGTQNYSNAPTVVVLTGDTVWRWQSPDGIAVPIQSGTFSIGGVGSGLFTDELQFLRSGTAVGFRFWPANDVIQTVRFTDPIFANWDLSTNWNSSALPMQYPVRDPVQTSRGALRIMGGSSTVLFSATVIPAPATALLGLGLLAGARRRR